jgi:hypothetical protein
MSTGNNFYKLQAFFPTYILSSDCGGIFFWDVSCEVTTHNKRYEVFSQDMDDFETVCSEFFSG